jgi:hypothetical protein
MPVLQSLIQLKHLYEEAYENFLGQSGAIVGLTPNDWTTADWMSRRSGENTIRQPTVNTNQNPGGIGTSMGEGYGRRYAPTSSVAQCSCGVSIYGVEEGQWIAQKGQAIALFEC